MLQQKGEISSCRSHWPRTRRAAYLADKMDEGWGLDWRLSPAEK